MAKNTIVMTLKDVARKVEDDIEVPLTITTNDLIVALNQAYDLGIDTNDVVNCFLKTENPIALLKGNRTLEEFGLHDGTVLIISDTQEA